MRIIFQLFFIQYLCKVIYSDKGKNQKSEELIQDDDLELNDLDAIVKKEMGNYNNSEISKDEEYLKIQKKLIGIQRFSQIKDDPKQKLVDIQSAIADSELEKDGKKASAQLAANDPKIQQQMKEQGLEGPWLSNQNVQTAQWTATLKELQPLSHIKIEFAFCPKKFKVQTSTSEDGDDFVDYSDFIENYEPQELKKPQSISSKKAQTQTVQFDESIWAKRVRILNEESLSGLIGIKTVSIFRGLLYVMIKQSESEQGTDVKFDNCLVTVGASPFNNGQNLLGVKHCLDTIMQGLHQELWIFNVDNQLQPYSQKDYCMEVVDGQKQDGSPLQLRDCTEIEATSGNDNRDKWVYDNQGYFHYMKNQSLCLTSMGPIQWKDQKGIRTYSESELDDHKYISSMAIDKDSQTAWVSQSTETATWTTIFPRIALEEIQIEWKYPAKEFEVFVLIKTVSPQDDPFEKNNQIEQQFLDKKTISDQIQASQKISYWKKIHTETDNSLFQTRIDTKQTNMRQISGIQIVMLKPQDDLQKNRESNTGSENVYGIEEIELIHKIQHLSVEDCLEGEAKNQTFVLEQFTYANLMRDHDIKEVIQIVNINDAEYEQQLSVLKQVQDQNDNLTVFGKNAQAQIVDISNLILFSQQQTINYKDKLVQTYQNETGRGVMSPQKRDHWEYTKKGVLKSYLRCDDLKKEYDYKKTGYYWIKNQCSKYPWRIHCDFENSQKGFDYLFVYDNVTFIQSQEDIEFKCAQFGLFPLQLQQKTQIQMLKEFLLQNNDIIYNQEDNFIPLGYDYNCDQFKCQNQFKSLNGFNTPYVNEFFDEVLIKDQTKMWNMIGFVQDLNIGFKNFLDDKFKVSGILCSSNEFNQEISYPDLKRFIPIDCTTTLTNNNYFDGDFGTQFQVSCPSGCEQNNEEKVEGNYIYEANDSICIKSIRQRQIDNNGGYIKLTIMENPNRLGEKAFSVLKWKGNMGAVEDLDGFCPMSKFVKKEGFESVTYESSFLQIQEKLPNKTFPSIVTDEAFKIVEHFQENTLVEVRQIIHKLKKDTSIENLIKNQLGPLRMNDIGPLVQSNQLIELKPKLDDEIKNTQMEVTDIENTITDLDNLNKIEQRNIWRMGPQAKIENAFSEFNNFDDQKLAEQFSEDYIQDEGLLEKSFIQISSTAPAVVPDLKSWQMRLIKDTYAHVNILQCINQQHNQQSQIYVKDKQFYCFTLETFFKAAGEEQFGILLKYQDEFNYYMLKFQGGSQGSKSIIKVKNGIVQVLKNVQDGGYLQLKWYRVRIMFKLNIIRAQVIEETGDNEIIIEAHDSEFAYGSVGYMSQGMIEMFFDQLTVLPLKCENLNKQIKEIYISPTCSRFTEIQKSVFEFVWHVEDVIDLSTNAPSEWKYEKYYKGEENAVVQKSNITSDSFIESGSFCILEAKRKTCRIGAFQFKYYADYVENAAIGVAIGYNDNNNMHLIKIKEKGCSIQRILKGVATTIGSTTNCWLQQQNWTLVTVVLWNSYIEMYMLENNSPKMVLSANITEIHQEDYWKYGFMTQNTGAAFSQIRTGPTNEILNVTEKVTEFTQETDRKQEFFRCEYENKAKYCAQHFRSQDILQNECQNNYCQVCCANEEKPARSKQLECQKKCQKNSKHTCSPKEKQVNQYCYKTHYENTLHIKNKEQSRLRCVRDLCLMCCSFSLQEQILIKIITQALIIHITIYYSKKQTFFQCKFINYQQKNNFRTQFQDDEIYNCRKNCILEPLIPIEEFTEDCSKEIYKFQRKKKFVDTMINKYKMPQDKDKNLQFDSSDTEGFSDEYGDEKLHPTNEIIKKQVEKYRDDDFIVQIGNDSQEIKHQINQLRDSDSDAISDDSDESENDSITNDSCGQIDIKVPQVQKAKALEIGKQQIIQLYQGNTTDDDPKGGSQLT